MKILVLGGMHGNEPLGKKLVQLIQDAPIPNIDAIMANEEAIRRNSRYIKNDLNRSFPGNIKSKDYETRRAAKILDLAKRYDVVLDFHNTHCPNNDCGFVGEDATAKLYDISSWLGLNKVIVADYDCINKYASNCLSLDISLGSPVINARWWFDKIVELSTKESVPLAADLQKYRFAYRITLQNRDKLRLKEQNLQAFKELEPGLATKMGVSSPAYPIFIGDGYTPYNYGGLLNKL